MEGEIAEVAIMQHVALSSFDKEACQPFFKRLTDFFHDHHHSDDQDASSYEELLYKIRRPYTPEMLDMIDDWMGLGKREWKEETQREVLLSLYACLLYTSDAADE